MTEGAKIDAMECEICGSSYLGDNVEVCFDCYIKVTKTSSLIESVKLIKQAAIQTHDPKKQRQAGRNVYKILEELEWREENDI